MGPTHRWLASLKPVPLALVSLALVAVVGLLDLATGYELAFSIFYLLPVSVAAWYGSRGLALAVCLLSALTWLISDFSAGHHYRHPLIPPWNAAVRLSTFGLVTQLLRMLRVALTLQAELAQNDGLTGLLNARAFKQRCHAQFQQTARLAASGGAPRGLSLGYIDLDGFKHVNDQLGHAQGDEVLKEVAATLRSGLRAADLGARLGGDEFAVLLPDTGEAGALVFFKRLHAALMAMAAEQGWALGFSVGVVVCPDGALGGDAALAEADALMYEVKRNGKNHIRVLTVN